MLCRNNFLQPTEECFITDICNGRCGKRHCYMRHRSRRPTRDNNGRVRRTVRFDEEEIGATKTSGTELAFPISDVLVFPRSSLLGVHSLPHDGV